MKKILTVVLSVVFALSLVFVASAEESTGLVLDINPENRYTDISEIDEYNQVYFGDDEEKEQEIQSNKYIYISVLCVLLVVAIIVLVVSLKRVPPQEDASDKLSTTANKKSDTDIADEEQEVSTEKDKE